MLINDKRHVIGLEILSLALQRALTYCSLRDAAELNSDWESSDVPVPFLNSRLNFIQRHRSSLVISISAREKEKHLDVVVAKTKLVS